MATINIGNLTFTHKGDYDGSTAYAKNDVVYYSTNGNAYIAKQATTGNVPTNATYWNQFAQGSGGIWNAGLSLGSASQKLRVNSAGNALEFFTEPAVTSDYVKLASGSQTSATGSLEIDGYFTSDYHVYKLYIVDWNPTSADHFAMRTMSGGSQNANASYRYNSGQAYKDSGSQSVGNAGAGWDDNRWRTNTDDWNTSRGNGSEITIYDPLDTANKNFFCYIQQIWRRNDNATLHSTFGGFTYDNGTTAISGLKIFPTNGNNQTIAHWSLYGIKF